MELWLSYFFFITVVGLVLAIESLREEEIKRILREEVEMRTGIPISDDEEVWYSQDGISWYRID